MASMGVVRIGPKWASDQRDPARTPSLLRSDARQENGLDAPGHAIQLNGSVRWLSADHREFVMLYVMSNRKLKEMAKRYRVSRPTQRNRVADLVGRLVSLDGTSADDYD